MIIQSSLFWNIVIVYFIHIVLYDYPHILKKWIFWVEISNWWNSYAFFPFHLKCRNWVLVWLNFQFSLFLCLQITRLMLRMRSSTMKTIFLTLCINVVCMLNHSARSIPLLFYHMEPKILCSQPIHTINHENFLQVLLKIVLFNLGFILPSLNHSTLAASELVMDQFPWLW